LQRKRIPLNAGACICEKAASICDDEGLRDTYLQQARFWWVMKRSRVYIQVLIFELQVGGAAVCTFSFSSVNSKWVAQQCVHSASHL